LLPWLGASPNSFQSSCEGEAETKSFAAHHKYSLQVYKLISLQGKTEKEKRKLAGLGKKYSPERIEKSSKSLKGKIPWNKGLTKNDERVQKYIDNNKHKLFIKKYILTTPDNLKLIFNGRKELQVYIKEINSTLKNKIDINILIKTKLYKDYKIELN